MAGYMCCGSVSLPLLSASTLLSPSDSFLTLAVVHASVNHENLHSWYFWRAQN